LYNYIIGVGTSYGHICASQESWPWWRDIAEVVSTGIKVVYSLPISNVQVRIVFVMGRLT